jgi:hypothetical protein
MRSMRRRTAGLVLLLVVALEGVMMAKLADAADAAGAELLALEKGFAGALLTGDVESLTRLTADE